MTDRQSSATAQGVASHETLGRDQRAQGSSVTPYKETSSGHSPPTNVSEALETARTDNGTTAAIAGPAENIQSTPRKPKTIGFASGTKISQVEEERKREKARMKNPHMQASDPRLTSASKHQQRMAMDISKYDEKWDSDDEKKSKARNGANSKTEQPLNKENSIEPQQENYEDREQANESNGEESQKDGESIEIGLDFDQPGQH